MASNDSDNDDTARNVGHDGAPVIRARRPADLDACVAVLAAVHAADAYPLQWPDAPAAWLTPSRLLRAWVAVDADASAGVDAGAIVGHVALRSAVGDAAAGHWTAASGLPDERVGEVARLFVAPDARGRGVASALLAGARAEAHQRALLPALEVLDHDRAALALYERLGWRRVASVPSSWATADGQHMLLHYFIYDQPVKRR